MRVHTACPRGFLGKMASELVARETERVSLKKNNFVYCKWLSFGSRKVYRKETKGTTKLSMAILDISCASLDAAFFAVVASYKRKQLQNAKIKRYNQCDPTLVYRQQKSKLL